jgi:Bacterial protein of unknown function (DUF853)
VHTTADDRQRSNKNFPIYGQYEQAAPRESAYEKLSRKAAARTATSWRADKKVTASNNLVLISRSMFRSACEVSTGFGLFMQYFT